MQRVLNFFSARCFESSSSNPPPISCPKSLHKRAEIERCENYQTLSPLFVAKVSCLDKCTNFGTETISTLPPPPPRPGGSKRSLCVGIGIQRGCSMCVCVYLCFFCEKGLQTFIITFIFITIMKLPLQHSGPGAVPESHTVSFRELIFCFVQSISGLAFVHAALL